MNLQGIIILLTLSLSAGLAQADGTAVEMPGDRGARDIFSSVAEFYGDIDGLLNRGWSHVNLREEQRVWMLRRSLSAFGDCVRAPAGQLSLSPDDREAWCAEMLVSGLEEVLGPVRWQVQQAAWQPAQLTP